MRHVRRQPTSLPRHRVRHTRLVVLVDSRRALAIAVRNGGARRRWTKLREWMLPAADGQPAERRATLARAAGNV